MRIADRQYAGGTCWRKGDLIIILKEYKNVAEPCVEFYNLSQGYTQRVFSTAYTNYTKPI